jgi:cytochrome P450 family 142 subfamily A polypeptide 1
VRTVIDDLDIAIASGEFWGRNPQRELAWLRANDPVHWDETDGVWGVARYDDVKDVEGRPDVFSNAGGIRPNSPPTPMLIDLDDPEHLRRRRLVYKGFTPQRVREQEPRIRAVVDRLLDAVCENGEMDFVADFAAWLPLIIIGDALGVDPADHPTLLKWSDDLMRGQGTTDAHLVSEMVAAFSGYAEYADGVIEARRGCPADDLMSILVHSEIEGDRLTYDEVLYDSLLILIGGDETTRHVITGGLYQLLADRRQWEELRADRSLVPGAVEESLRWVSPIKNMVRTATRDVELRGKQIRAGQELLMLYPSANRDEAHFDDPQRFDVHRAPNDHVAFGFGPHFCLGAPLARLELRIAFEQLLERVPDIRLVDDTEPAYRPASFVSGYEKMRVAFSPSAPVGT